MTSTDDGNGGLRPATAAEIASLEGVRPMLLPTGTKLPDAVAMMTGRAPAAREPALPPCVHRGGELGLVTCAEGCAAGWKIKSFACAVHGSCTIATRGEGVSGKCRGCGERQEPSPVANSDTTPKGMQGLHTLAVTPTSAPYSGLLLPDLPDPLPTQDKYPAPPDWAWRADVRAAHQRALRQLMNAPLPAPVVTGTPEDEGDGLVTAGGGPYWPLTRMCVRMLRQWSDLPVQVWHRGDAEPVHPGELADLSGITYHDATAVTPAPRWSGDPRYRGWQVKAVALAHCGLRRALWLDADAYPIGDPAPLLELASKHRFAAWDSVHSAGTCGWEAFGIDRGWGERVPAWQGGHLAIDRIAFWREIALFLWLCQHADYSFQQGIGYGDESQWRVALALTGGTYRNLGQSVMLGNACLQRLPGAHPLVPGETVYVHRFAGKGPPMDGAPPGTSPGLPLDDLAGRFYRGETPLVPALRPGTNDAAVWQAVVEQNEYRLPDDMTGWTVLDVGAHVGAFAWACLARGAAFIQAVESDRENGELAVRNFVRAPGRGQWEASLVRAAAWGNVMPPGRLHAVRRRPNAGMSKLALAGGPEVPVLPLDETIRWAGARPVDLLKLDCEGAEWPCLFTAKLLGRVRRIAGEYHLAAADDPLYRVEGYEISTDALRRHLGAEGFTVEIESPNDGGAGHFWATREG